MTASWRSRVGATSSRRQALDAPRAADVVRPGNCAAACSTPRRRSTSRTGARHPLPPLPSTRRLGQPEGRWLDGSGRRLHAVPGAHAGGPGWFRASARHLARRPLSSPSSSRRSLFGARARGGRGCATDARGADALDAGEPCWLVGRRSSSSPGTPTSRPRASRRTMGLPIEALVRRRPWCAGADVRASPASVVSLPESEGATARGGPAAGSPAGWRILPGAGCGAVRGVRPPRRPSGARAERLKTRMGEPTRDA